MRPDEFKEKDFERFRDDRHYQEWRRGLEDSLNVGPENIAPVPQLVTLAQAAHLATLYGHPIQKFAQNEFRKDMLKRLAKKPWIADHRKVFFLFNYRQLC